ncbi:MAG TPA: M14 metallopeptidase family protein [Caulifigura sp.]|nr:M14 metallopeptidase family protein [Caulifigura sp.]
MYRLLLAITAIASLNAVALAADPSLDSPETFLKRPIGTDFQLADWTNVSGYYRQLDKQSPRVVVESVGKTTEGREFLIAIISSEENLAKLPEIKANARIVADPRGKSDAEKAKAIEQGKVILFITPTMHSTEVAATEMGMHLAWQLASSEEEPFKSARQNAVVIITPSLNPDGVDHVVSWYRENAYTPFEGSGMTRLYQYYTGHDNNRDWFMLTQAETRHLTKLFYKEWFPQILWDVHQQGNSRERFFVPPYRDPLNPNIDPGIVAATNLIGTRASVDLNREGLTGVASGVSYDNWWNGGNRGVPCRHNIIGILTEAASAKLGSPVFLERSTLKDPNEAGSYQASNQFVNPWPGGWWRLKDIQAYELAFARSLLGSINREPQFWTKNAMEASERSIAAGKKGGPRAWIIPADNVDLGATRRMLEALMAGGVEVHTSASPFKADGLEYPPGSIVVWRDQPYGNYVKDLFELQKFPSGTKPYDVSGWTLPLMMGVRRVEVEQDFQATTQPAATAADALKSFTGDARLKPAGPTQPLSLADSDAWTQFVEGLGRGKTYRYVTAGPQMGMVFTAAATEKPNGNEIALTKLPRIGVYSPWSASMDEGWLRWVFDSFKIPFVTVRNEMIRAGELGKTIDVLIIPDVAASELDHGRSRGSVANPFTEGLDPEGSIAVEEFVRKGGTLIAFDGSGQWVVDLLRLPLVNVVKEPGAKGFMCPGSVLRGIVEPRALTAGMDDDIALFFSDSAGWRTMTKAERETAGREERSVQTFVQYAPSRLLLSGYLDSAKTIEGQGAWVSSAYHAGQVHLFGFRPHYRGWSQATFHLLFRAALIAPATTWPQSVRLTNSK